MGMLIIFKIIHIMYEFGGFLFSTQTFTFSIVLKFVLLDDTKNIV